MNITLRMTAEGLIRALRARVHGLAEDAEARYGRHVARPVSRKAPRAIARRRTEGRDRDDVAGR
ncbi:MAG: hypothetical protein KF694_02970 [Mesorhizobium sp.]|nr:hypothetical protein [Mesorhizobium sp.]